MFELSGKLLFDPENKTKKHERQSEWKRTAMIMIDDGELARYYAWFIEKRYNLKLSRPLRGTHLTIINDRFFGDQTGYKQVRNKYDGTEIKFFIDPDVRTDGNHWWMNAVCPMAEQIREEATLNPKPYFGFHITIGRPHERDEHHSHYIHRLIRTYGKEYVL